MFGEVEGIDLQARAAHGQCGWPAGSDRPRALEHGAKTAMVNLVSRLTNTVGGLAEEPQCGSIVKPEIVPRRPGHVIKPR